MFDISEFAFKISSICGVITVSTPLLFNSSVTNDLKITIGNQYLTTLIITHYKKEKSFCYLLVFINRSVFGPIL
jgi:hypothetical protein